MRGFQSFIGGLAGLLAIVCVLMLLGGAFGTRLALWDFRFGFLLLQLGLYAGGGAIVAGIIYWVFVPLTGVRTRGFTALAAILLAAAALAIPLYQISVATSVPPIHDISTDTDDPPAFVSLLAERPAGEGINPPDYAGPETAARQAEAYPDIVPQGYVEAPDVVFARALAAAEGLGWRIVAAVPEDGRIEATETSFFFGFVDDIVIRVRPGPGTGTVVDVRSKSRVGVSDVGANARRIRAFFTEMAEG